MCEFTFSLASTPRCEFCPVPPGLRPACRGLLDSSVPLVTPEVNGDVGVCHDGNETVLISASNNCGLRKSIKKVKNMKFRKHLHLVFFLLLTKITKGAPPDDDDK